MKLSEEQIKHYCGSKEQLRKFIPAVRPKNLIVSDLKLTGEAPKRFIRIYEGRRNNCEKRNSRTWPSYIAKFGSKSYPSEIIA